MISETCVSVLSGKNNNNLKTLVIILTLFFHSNAHHLFVWMCSYSLLPQVAVFCGFAGSYVGYLVLIR